jgi:hypothetical protein
MLKMNSWLRLVLMFPLLTACGGGGEEVVCSGPACSQDVAFTPQDATSLDAGKPADGLATDGPLPNDHLSTLPDLADSNDSPDGMMEDNHLGSDVELYLPDGKFVDEIALEDSGTADVPLVDTGSSDTPCIPDCNGLECGPDGCGGDCGGCDDSLDCTDDSCGPGGLCQHTDNGQPCQPVEVEHLYFDVVVVGAGTGGVSAAIEAARLGMNVALLERTDWIGGQMTGAAVSNMDEGHKNRDSGIYKEFIDKIKAHYGALGKSIGTCYWSNGTYCFEPSVGRSILEEMVAAEGNSISLFTRATVTDVLANGSVVQGVVADVLSGNANQPYAFHAIQTIDATETGDVLALGPAPYRLGKGTSYAPQPTSCIQEFTYTAVIRKYGGSPPAGFSITSPPPGYSAALQDHFESIVVNNGAHWVTGPNEYPADWETHTGYRGMPDSAAPGSAQSSQPELLTRTGVNWANDYPITAGDLETSSWQQVFCEGKLRTLQFLYYAQQILGHSQWSVANDEGYATQFQLNDNLCSEIPANLKTLEQNLPVHPYVREGRRMIGVKLLTAPQIYRQAPCAGCAPRALTTFPSSVAVGDYAVDLHGCHSNSDLEQQFENEGDVPPGFQAGAFQLPLEVFVPAAVDGLLAAEKNLSVTRLVNGAIRLQPITMLTGQAAGAIAALAIARGLQPRNLHPAIVQDHLVDQGCMLAVWPFADVPRWHPAWADIQFTAARELMMGYGETEYAPDDEMSRAMMAVLMTRLFDIAVGPGPGNPTFGDMPKSHWAYDYVEALYAAGLTSGCSLEELLFCPDDPVVRAAAATFLMKGLGYDGEAAPANPYFNDIAPSHWGYPWVQWAAKEGIMGGCGGGKFCPDDPITRAESAGVARKIVMLKAD